MICVMTNKEARVAIDGQYDSALAASRRIRLQRRPRVLILAESANPEWVSVPLIGWSLAQALAQQADAHLVTQVRNREAIVRAGLVEGRDFTAIDSERIERPMCRLSTWLRGGAEVSWTTASALAALSYPYFEHLVWKRFKAEIMARRYDVVHRVTPLSPTYPSLLARRCRQAGVHFVLGPLNGGVPWPREFAHIRRQEKEWLSFVRDAHKLLPGYRQTRRAASAILIGSRDTWRQMPRQYHDKCHYIAENAIDPTRFPKSRTHRAELPLRLVFVGRLVPYKGADILLEAAAPLVRAGLVTVEIIGDGPQLPELQKIVDERQLAAGVKLVGWVPHQQLQHHLIKSDLFVFPSIREFGGGVALEAMAVGVPPVVSDYGGPGELVTPQSGYLVPMGTRQQLIARFRQVLDEVVENPAQIDIKSQAAQRRVAQLYTWEAKAAQIVAIYDRLLSGEEGPTHGSAPDRLLD